MKPITGDADRVVYVNGEFVPEGKATVSVFDHVVLYGDGVFDTCCAWAGAVFRLDEHLDRFYESAHAVKLEIPCDKPTLRDVVLEVVRRNGLRNAYVKMIVTRGVGPLPLMNPYGCTPTLVVFAIPYISLIDEDKVRQGIRARTSSMRRIPSECLDAKIKSCNYLNHILMRIEAWESGFDEAIELSIDGFVAEAPGYNIFTYKGGKLFTPTEDILVGITRQTVIELGQEEGIPTVEGRLSAFDLYNADEVFLCSTAGGIFAVVDVDGRRIGTGEPGPVTTRLNEKYMALLESGRHSTPVYQ